MAFAGGFRTPTTPSIMKTFGGGGVDVTATAVGPVVGVRLLGPVRAVLDGAKVIELPKKERALLALLALRAGTHVSVATIVDGLWGEQPPETATNTVQAHVHQLRRVLGRGTVQTFAGGYQLALAPDIVDVARFSSLAAAGAERLAAADPQRGLVLLTEALTLWHGDALVDCRGIPFADSAASALEEERLSVIENRIDADLALGHGPTLMGEIERLLAIHRYRERLWAARMTALNQSGRRAEELETYVTARKIMVDELGIEPGPELQQLHTMLLSGAPSTAAVRPAMPTLSGLEEFSTAAQRPATAQPPAPVGALIGRASDTEAATALLLQPGVRVVTILGPGGVGKTRFATDLAISVRNRFPGGVAWIPLAGLRDPSHILAAVAQAIGQHVDPTPQSLGSWFAGNRWLLLLDNIEHLLPDAASVVEALVSAAPTVCVLGTSRVALHVAGEHRYQLAPLSGPAPDESNDPEAVLGSPAAELFLERARATSPALVVDDAAVAAIATLCGRLDGLPLALELAAARTSILSLPALASRLDSRLTLLTASARPSVDRQKSLRATLEWSFDLLSAPARRLIAWLSVFRNGFALEAAEFVGKAAFSAEDYSTVLDVLGELADASLMTTTTDPATASVRFSMLDTVTEFGHELLNRTPHDAEAARAAHMAYYVDMLNA